MAIYVHVQLLAITKASTVVWPWKMIWMMVMMMNTTRAKMTTSTLLRVPTTRKFLLHGVKECLKP